MLYIYYGPDTFSRDEALRELLGELGDITALDGSSLALRELRLAADALPFLESRRLVVVEGLLTRFEGRRSLKESESQLARGIRDYVGQMPPTTVLVFRDGELRRDNALLGQVSAAGEVRLFPLLGGARLQTWIQERAGRLGVALAPEAVQLMVFLVGGNLWSLSQELEKLRLYAGGRVVGEADVRLMVADAREAKVFALTDAVVQRQLAPALRELNRLSLEGQEAAYLLFMITRQFRLNLQARELLSQGCPPVEIGTRLGIASGFALQKTLGQAQRAIPSPGSLFRELLNADLAIKRGGGYDTLEMLVVGLCQGIA